MLERQPVDVVATTVAGIAAAIGWEVAAIRSVARDAVVAGIRLAGSMIVQLVKAQIKSDMESFTHPCALIETDLKDQ